MGNLRCCRLILLSAILNWLLLLAVPAWASQQPEADSAIQPSYEEQSGALSDQIEQSASLIKELETRREGRQGVAAMVLDRRIEAVTLEALDLSHQLVQLVIDREAAGEDPGPYRETARQLLQTIPKRVRAVVKKRLAVSDFDKDIGALGATEQIALEADRELLSKQLVAGYNILLRNLELSGKLDLDTSGQRDFLIGSLADVAADQSIALEVAQRRSKTLERQVATLPDDVELAAQARVSGERVKRLNDTLRQLVDMMEPLGLRVVEYRQQLVAATGTVTTDILDFEVATGLLQRWLHAAGTWISTNLPRMVFNLLLFLLIVWAALALSRLTQRLVERALNRKPSNLSQLLRRTIISSTGNIVLIIGLLFGLAQLGISVAPLLAGLGIAGFIVGFALQDTLGNFASGVMILLYRPYDVGDFIETNGVLGKVSQMSLVNTTVLTIDNQTLVLPNSKIWGDVIKNVTAQSERRVDMVFGIGYADDVARAEQVLSEILQGHSKVLDDPAPVIRLHTLNESSVDFVVRPWVRTEDYWDVYWDITRAVKMRFDEEGISIPFPQRDIHLFTESNGAIAIPAAADIEQPPATPT